MKNSTRMVSILETTLRMTGLGLRPTKSPTFAPVLPMIPSIGEYIFVYPSWIFDALRLASAASTDAPAASNMATAVSRSLSLTAFCSASGRIRARSLCALASIVFASATILILATTSASNGWLSRV